MFKRISGAVMMALWLAMGPVAAGAADAVAAVEDDAEALPSAELLDFLGDWDGGDDEWMGPEFFEVLEKADQEHDHDQEQEK